ncbi:MATE family efflux transporter [Streptococcus massiliensis]|uniref:Probable multidrug resistance protein NorM n=1 Tax=Streptococcus massiliensis TaxID=313439 RepID=A0A380L0D7_9STRE|nr:MATE family efflux transporter [Streptococcus massiliensis]SUN77019.1 putative MATE family transporter [Streptococcus massiliensis]
MARKRTENASLTRTGYKKIMHIALPAMAENFLQMLMNMVDSYLVASLGLVAISGVSVAGNIITIYQAIFIALGAAISSLISKALGQGDQDSLAYHATESLKLTLLLSLVLGLISLFWGRELLGLLGTEAAVAQAGGLFLSLVGGTIIFLGMMTTLGALVRVTHNPRIPMYVSLLTNILNIIFSSLAIFLFHWGIVGVALGTILARLVGVILLWRELTLPFAKWTWSLDKELLKLSLPAAGERLMMRAGDVVIIAMVVQFGTDVVAGNAIGEVLSQFDLVPSFGVATATVMLVAHAFGQNDWQTIRQLTRQSYYLAFVSMLPLALAVFLFGQPLTLLFTDNSGAVTASLSVILFSLLGVPMTAGTLIYTALWQGLGNAKLPFYATTIGMWLIRIVLGYLLGVTLGLGLPGVWTGTLVDNGFRWLFLQRLYSRKMKKLNGTLDEEKT